MRFIIYGVGAVGGVVGGQLARDGNDVILIGRGQRVRAINEGGLRLVTPTATCVLHIPAVSAPDQIAFRPDDVVFLCVKGQDSEPALRALHEMTRDVPIFCLQNGVRNEEIAAQLFPRVYGVMIRIGALYLADNEAVGQRDPPAWLTIARYPRGKDEVVDDVAGKLLHAGFKIRVVDDVMPYKWGKLMVNVGNSVDAICGGKSPASKKIVQAAQREAADLLAKAGIRWVSVEQVEREWPELAAAAIDPFSTTHPSSTFQSLARKQGTVETEFLNGEFVRLAARLGKKAPLNEALVDMSLEMAAKRESPGKCTPEQLSALLHLNINAT